MFRLINTFIVSILLFLSLNSTAFATPVEHVKRDFGNFNDHQVDCRMKGPLSMEDAYIQRGNQEGLRNAYRDHCEAFWGEQTIPRGVTLEQKVFYGSEQDKWAILTLTAHEPLTKIGFECFRAFNSLVNSCFQASGIANTLMASCIKAANGQNATLCVWPQKLQK